MKQRNLANAQNGDPMGGDWAIGETGLVGYLYNSTHGVDFIVRDQPRLTDQLNAHLRYGRFAIDSASCLEIVDFCQRWIEREKTK